MLTSNITKYYKIVLAEYADVTDIGDQSFKLRSSVGA